MLKKVILFIIYFLFFEAIICFGGDQFSMKELMDKIDSFTLDNGMQFIVMQREKTPVVSFVTFVKVGSVDENIGETGIAHIFEHMAFKGTKDIGTKDWNKEKIVLEELDNVYREYIQCINQGQSKDKCNLLKSRFNKLLEEANSYVIHNEFSKIIEKNGGEDLNAGTSTDYTIYYSSFPSNKVELWFSLESDRLKNPVFREFYTEKEVIREERRMRVDTSPMGKLIEGFRSIAFSAHPYSHPTIGWDSDIVNTTIRDVKQFYKKYYVPQNITIAIVGDVKIDEIKKLAQVYFGSMEKGEDPPIVSTKEPKLSARKEITIYDKAQPMYIRGYHVPGYGHKDYIVLRVLEDILSDGRSSRLYSRLVLEKKLALSVSAFYGFPGERYPCLFGILAIPNIGVSIDELSKAIDLELEDIMKNGVKKDEITRAYTLEKAELIREMESNLGMARELAYSQAIYGDWKKLFSMIESFKDVSSQHIQDVIKKYFKEENMVEGKLIFKDKK